MNKQKESRTYFIFHWILFFLLGFFAFREFLNINILAYVPGTDLLKSRRFIVFILACVATAAVWFSFIFLHNKKRINRLLESIRGFPKIINTFIVAVALLLPAVIKWLIPLPENFTLLSWTMVFLFYSASLVAGAIFATDATPKKHMLLTAIFFMASGFAYSVLARMNLVTSYPFTTYWSEGNRFFDYSTLFGSYRYTTPHGENIKAFINWGMQLPWTIPFIFPNLSIGAFRFWNQLVWILPSILLGYLAINKPKDNNKVFIAIIFSVWAYLFLDQGPVYAPLIIAAILTVIAVRLRLSFGAILIIIASYYVRSARWTWGYAPGLWAGLLSILAIENPSLEKGHIKEIVKPVTLGLAGYFGGQLLPSIIRVLTRGSELALLPNPTASTTRQPLIWDRLWPNPTYPPGIVLGLVWAVLPVLIFIAMLLFKKYWKMNWMQSFSVLTVSGAFLAVGIIASTKIGGGSNLHNLDMFIMSLLLISAAAINNLVSRKSSPVPYEWIWVIPLIFCLITPVTYTLQNGERLELPPTEKIEEAVSAVENKVEEYSSQGEILFIDHRQLLTFRLVKNVTLIDDYEKKYLMDNAMASKASYFDAFYKDLADRRFVLIVNEPTNLISRGSEYSFGEENDAYVKWVTAPLLCQYEPLYTSHATALELLIPRTTPAPEYLPCEEIFANLNE